MADDNFDKLTVDLDVDTSGLVKGSEKADKVFEKLKTKLDNNSRKVKRKTKKIKEGLEGITDETEAAGDALKKSGNSAKSFFSPMTKGLLGIAGAVFALKAAIDQVSRTAQKFADIRTEARESGVSAQEVVAWGRAEEKVNIPKGTYVNAVRQMRTLQANAKLGNIPARNQLLVGGAKLGLGSSLLNGDPEKLVQAIIERSQSLPERYRKDFLDNFGVGAYANLSPQERASHKESRDRNLAIENERRRNGTYDQAAAAQSDFIEGKQKFERAWEDFVVQIMPIVVDLLRGMSRSLEIIAHPLDALTGKLGGGIGGVATSLKLSDDKRNEANKKYGSNLQPGATVSDLTDVIKRFENEKRKQTSMTLPDNVANLPVLSSQNAITNQTITFNQTNNIRSDNPGRAIKDAAFQKTEIRRLSAVIS